MENSKPRRTSSVNSSPAVANGVVYVAGEGCMYALEASTGALLWCYGAGYPVSSPAVADGVVYVGDNGYVEALEASTGALLWSYYAGSLSSPAVANGVVYIGAGYEPGNVYAFNARNGAVLWSYATAGDEVDSSPAVANGVVYINSYDGNLVRAERQHRHQAVELPHQRLCGFLANFASRGEWDGLCRLHGRQCLCLRAEMRDKAGSLIERGDGRSDYPSALRNFRFEANARAARG